MVKMNGDEKVRSVKKRLSGELLPLAGVSGVGTEERGNDRRKVIVVHVDTDDPKLMGRIPKEIDGIPVETVITGPFKKLRS